MDRKNISVLNVSGLLKSEPLLLPGRHMLNLGMMLANVGALAWYLGTDSRDICLAMLGATTALSSVMGVTLTAAIGGKLVCVQRLFENLVFFLFFSAKRMSSIV